MQIRQVSKLAALDGNSSDQSMTFNQTEHSCLKKTRDDGINSLFSESGGKLDLDLFSLTSSKPASMKGHHINSYLSPKVSSLEKKLRQSIIQGNCANGKELIDTVLNKIEREVDRCVDFQGFQCFIQLVMAQA